MCSKALHCTSLPLCFYFGSEPAHHCLACKDQQSSKKPHFAFYGLIWTVRLVKCRKMGFSTATSLFQRSVAHQKQNNFLIIALNRRFISNTHIRIYSVDFSWGSDTSHFFIRKCRMLQFAKERRGRNLICRPTVGFLTHLQRCHIEWEKVNATHCVVNNDRRKSHHHFNKELQLLRCHIIETQFLHLFLKTLEWKQKNPSASKALIAHVSLTSQ